MASILVAAIDVYTSKNLISSFDKASSKASQTVALTFDIEIAPADDHNELFGVRKSKLLKKTSKLKDAVSGKHPHF